MGKVKIVPETIEINSYGLQIGDVLNIEKGLVEGQKVIDPFSGLEETILGFDGRNVYCTFSEAKYKHFNAGPIYQHNGDMMYPSNTICYYRCWPYKMFEK